MYIPKAIKYQKKCGKEEITIKRGQKAQVPKTQVFNTTLEVKRASDPEWIQKTPKYWWITKVGWIWIASKLRRGTIIFCSELATHTKFMLSPTVTMTTKSAYESQVFLAFLWNFSVKVLQSASISLSKVFPTWSYLLQVRSSGENKKMPWGVKRSFQLKLLPMQYVCVHLYIILCISNSQCGPICGHKSKEWGHGCIFLQAWDKPQVCRKI